jgi:MobA/MobL family
VESLASYHLSVHPNVSRGKGQSLVRTAAYNDRARLVDERTGEVWDYRHLGAALASGIYPPKGAPDWAHDLGQLVNEVERFEKRSDSQLAMNFDIALPHEQTLEQNRRLMQDFVREQFQRKGYAAHFAIHPPDRNGDDRNIHAHVLVTLRKIDEHGFARTKAEQQERYRNRGEYVEGLRDAWEKLANRHLERNGYDARIDRRSLEDRGIEREPEQHRGPAVTAMEREGNVTRIGDEIRRRQHHFAELKALAAEERQIDAQIIDLEARRAERQAREAAKGLVDEVRPETVAREFSAHAGRTTEPGAWDRDAADRAWMKAVEDAAIQPDYAAAKGRRDDIWQGTGTAARETATEAAQAQEHGRAPSAPEQTNTRATEPEREPAPARDAPYVIYLGPPAELDRAAGIVGGLADGVEKALGAALDAAADFIAPPPPPTKEQVQQEQRAEEAERPLRETARSKAEWEAWLVEQLQDDLRRRARHREEGYDRDDDGGRERERER